MLDAGLLWWKVADTHSFPALTNASGSHRRRHACILACCPWWQLLLTARKRGRCHIPHIDCCSGVGWVGVDHVMYLVKIPYAVHQHVLTGYASSMRA